MQCKIYRSSKRDEMYLYVKHEPAGHSIEEPPLKEPDFACVPVMVQQAFGRATFVMQLDLSTQHRLARVPIGQVIEALETRGFFLQMPPDGLINPNAVSPEGLRGA